MHEDKLILDKQTFKALSTDTRIQILKALHDKDKTATQLAQELGITNSSIKEHLDLLKNSQLIEQEDTNRKWKFYTLTLKAKRIVNPSQYAVTVGFYLSTLGFIVTSGYELINNVFFHSIPLESAQVEMVAMDTQAKSFAMTAPLEPVAEPVNSMLIITIVLLITTLILGTLYVIQAMKRKQQIK